MKQFIQSIAILSLFVKSAGAFSIPKLSSTDLQCEDLISCQKIAKKKWKHMSQEQQVEFASNFLNLVNWNTEWSSLNKSQRPNFRILDWVFTSLHENGLLNVEGMKPLLERFMSYNVGRYDPRVVEVIYSRTKERAFAAKWYVKLLIANNSASQRDVDMIANLTLYGIGGTESTFLLPTRFFLVGYIEKARKEYMKFLLNDQQPAYKYMKHLCKTNRELYNKSHISTAIGA